MCIGWCAVEGAEEQWETVITAEVKGRASFPLPETYFANLRPDSVHVVSAHANSGQAHALCARVEDNTLHAEVVCAETGRPIAARLTVLVRGATARSEGPWPLGPYSRIEESRRFHAATRQHR